MYLLTIALITLSVALASTGVWCEEPQPRAAPSSMGEGLGNNTGGVPLHEGVVRDGLDRVVGMDWKGAGKEASGVSVWAHGREGLFLKRSTVGWLIEASGESLRVSEELGSALNHMNQFLSMESAGLSQPGFFEELKSAVFSPEGVAAIREIFERSIRRGVHLEGNWIFLEAGGEATLDSSIRFHEVPDPSRPVFEKLCAVLADPAGVLCRVHEIGDLYQSHPMLLQDIDYGGTLKNVLERMPALEARGVPEDQRERLLKTAVRNALLNSADSWTLEADEHFKVIASREWSGLYLGGWHIHQPVYTPEGWAAAGSPSGPDMENARTASQFLVLAFHPDGFDLYDLTELGGGAAVDPSKIRNMFYRSPAWRSHFAQLHRALVDRK